MAALAGDLSKQIKGHSEAAQAFRPWWDNLEDNFMYSFVILGIMIAFFHEHSCLILIYPVRTRFAPYDISVRNTSGVHNSSRFMEGQFKQCQCHIKFNTKSESNQLLRSGKD